MPIYEYQCNGCGYQLEILQKIQDVPLQTCPQCEEDVLQKLVSAASFQLKGTGWYETDFKHKAKPKPKASEQGKAPAKEGEKTGAADPKAAAVTSEKAASLAKTTTSSKETDA